MIRFPLRTFSAILAALVFAAPVLGTPAQAGFRQPTISTYDTSHAIKGFDPVAYFTDGKPEKGSAQFSYEWKGASWLFTSARHRDMFKADPARYAPQFGGYCAYAIAKGHTAPGDPKIWSIVDNKLYLNFSPSTHRKWEADTGGMIAAGLANWPSVLGSNAPATAGGANR